MSHGIYKQRLFYARTANEMNEYLDPLISPVPAVAIGPNWRELHQIIYQRRRD